MEGKEDARIVISKKKSATVVWTQDKDLILLKEIAAEGVLQHKMKSRERGAGWLTVAGNLSPSFPSIEVTPRAVRDHFAKLARKHKIEMNKEERATGIGGKELTEVEALLEELNEMSEETDRRMEEENEKKRQGIEKEKEQAVEMRKRAMETFGETKKREGDGNGKNGKNEKRRKSGDTFQWLKEKAEMEKEMKQDELNEKREERESQKEERMLFFQHLQQQTEAQQQQQQQQQQQFAMLQQQMLTMMQQQQQQTQMFANLLNKNNNN